MKAIIEPKKDNKVTLRTDDNYSVISIENGVVTAQKIITSESSPTPNYLGVKKEDISLEDANIDEKTLEKAAWHQIQQTGKEFEIIEWKGDGYYQVLPNGKMKFATKNSELASEANADGISNYYVTEKNIKS